MKSEEKANSPTLFPILQPALTGLPKFAAEAHHVDGGHLVEFRTLEVHSVLSRINSKRHLPLDISINPYRGCEFGCKYCYARYTHGFMAPREPGATTYLSAPESFERVIFLKQNAAWLVEQELKKIDPRLYLALGTATDPYQPIERRARITRSVLEVFARKHGYRLGIVTKSNLIVRDIDLLQQIAARNELSVNLTITTLDAALARKLEPRAPRPDLRFAAVKQLREQGIAAGVLCAPVLPGITDSPRAIDHIARRAAEARALFFSANPLFLKSCSRETYFGFLRQHFPELVADYQKRYRYADFTSQTYRRKLAEHVGQAVKKYGLYRRPGYDDEFFDSRQKAVGPKRPIQFALSIPTSA